MAIKCNKILVVEDEAFLANIYKVKLEKEGYDVKIAYDGVEAFEILKDFFPEIILLDLIMPRKDGFEVLHDLSKDKKLRNIPVITLTNLGQQSDKDRVNQYNNVLEYLVKSNIAINDIMEKINKVCRPKQKKA